jgi:hypothetical protein
MRYANDAQQSVEEAKRAIPWWGWIAGVGASVLGVLRFVPGAGGATADLAWRVLAPASSRDEDRRRDLQAHGFRDLVTLIEHLRNDQRPDHRPSEVQGHHQTAIGSAG